jgi:hypothetical protein
MTGKLAMRTAVVVLLVAVACLGGRYASGLPFDWAAGSSGDRAKAAQHGDQPPPSDALEGRFVQQVRPFVERYCVSCHSGQKPKGRLDLSHDTSFTALASHARQWQGVLERLEAQEMPPDNAPEHPKADERASVIAWIKEWRDREAERHAGDPGPVLAHRLSNAELDYTIRDLTGVDIRPAREFPVDPANEAGFDNSGESLTMSPTLLQRYLSAARLVADHIVLKPEGFVFAPHPAVTDTDRDKYCVNRIMDYYKRHQVNYADYFLAAWYYRHREQLGKPKAPLSAFATDAGLSAKYLAMIWSLLAEDHAETGPLAAVHKLWRDLPQTYDKARPACQRLGDLIGRLRKTLMADVKKLSVDGISPGSQPLLLWRNRQLAGLHRSYRGEVAADLRKLGDELTVKESDLKPLFTVDEANLDKEKLRASLQRFCQVFPEAFVISDRGPYFDPKAAGKGRPLTAGFHLMVGYFRDDQPLCELTLSDQERAELDGLWQELNFITQVPLRQYKDFIFFERAEPPRFMFEAEFDFARSEDKDAITEEKISRLAKLYLEKARAKGAKGDAEEAITTYFGDISAQIRSVERARLAAQPSHLDALTKFAERAYRRPLTKAQRLDLLAYYQSLRSKEGLNHEDALRDTLVSVLMSPHFCYRFTVTEPGSGVQPLSDYELASRLSYFLWSSMPDQELLAQAAAGELHKRDVLIAQTRRMLHDPRVRGLATEFAGNWLDFRRFAEHNAVDRQRFPSFTNELRQSMFEEPIRYFMDLAQRNRSMLDLLYGNDTFVNRSLARHYGMPLDGTEDTWVHIADARPFGRGGLLPMAVFLTKNAPGLRTSPVKRGYWVVRRLLGEQIPPPPPTVPELPSDEANLGELTLPEVLSRHRADKSCAACHRRFDSIGLVFEDFGPIGERRTKDLGGRPVDTTAIFPDGKEGSGLQGLRAYLKEKRQGDFVDNLCRKLFSYALGRSLLLSDTKALADMRSRLTADGHALGSMVEAIVTSRQFLNKRGRDDARGQ